MVKLRILAGVVFGLLALGSAASAEEVKAQISASMLLSIMAQPSAPRVSALDESLRDPGPAPRSPSASGITIVVRNPCPPGDVHYEPPSLPGRRARY
jgi:hypothetical protein